MALIPKLTLLEGPVPQQEFELTENEIIIGRESTCDLVVATSSVSRPRARLRKVDGNYYIEDTGSPATARS